MPELLLFESKKKQYGCPFEFYKFISVSISRMIQHYQDIIKEIHNSLMYIYFSAVNNISHIRRSNHDQRLISVKSRVKHRIEMKYDIDSK